MLPYRPSSSTYRSSRRAEDLDSIVNERFIEREVKETGVWMQVAETNWQLCGCLAERVQATDLNFLTQRVVPSVQLNACFRLG